MKAKGPSPTFRIIAGVQGDIWSPLLLGLAIEFVMRTAVEEDKRGLKLMPRRKSRYPADKLSDLDYADHKALFEEIDAEMTETAEVICYITGKLGLNMSYKQDRNYVYRTSQCLQSCRNPLVMRALFRWWITLNTLELSVVQMGPITKS